MASERSHSLKTFVANRILALKEICNSEDWRHVSTDENPADIGSRGCTPYELKENDLWWHGPPWLQKPLEE